MIKELWTLIKLLFTGRPSDFQEEEKLKMNYFPFRGYKYMSWCGYIISRKDNPEIPLPDWIHENIHLYQAKRHKFWIGYYLAYLWNFLIGFIVIWSWKGAYKTSMYELEAYANEGKGWDYMEEVNPWKYYYSPLQRRMLWKDWDKYKKIFLT